MNRVHENGRACNACGALARESDNYCRMCAAPMCSHALAREGDHYCNTCAAPISAEAREAVAERAREIDQEVRALKPEGSARDRRAYRAGYARVRLRGEIPAVRREVRAMWRASRLARVSRGRAALLSARRLARASRPASLGAVRAPRRRTASRPVARVESGDDAPPRPRASLRAIGGES